MTDMNVPPTTPDTEVDVRSNVISMLSHPNYRSRNPLYKSDADFVACECGGFNFGVMIVPDVHYGVLSCTSCRNPISSLGVIEIPSEDRLVLSSEHADGVSSTGPEAA